MPTFETVRFGTLEYSEEDVVNLVEGLVGLPELRRWLILDLDGEIPLRWFQSLDRGDFGFPVTQPYLYVEDYACAPSPAIQKRLGTTASENIVTLIITTVHSGGAAVTGNLVAPLMVDIETRRGIQMSLDDDRYEIRQEIDYFKFGLAVQSESSDNGSPHEGEPYPAEETATDKVAEVPI